ncbi:MAG: class I SAM-dependent methyltransferase [Candidatus Sericytochromatia bacterium]
MFTLRYAFDQTCFFDSLLAQNLANALSELLELKLESSNAAQTVILNDAKLYGLFSKPLLQSDFYLHTGPTFQPDPASINLWWGPGSEWPSHLAAADQRWSFTSTGLSALEKAFPTHSGTLPMCLDLSNWQNPTAPPSDLELEPGQQMLLWQAAPHAKPEALQAELSMLLATFIPLSAAAPDAVLVLQLAQVSPDFEDQLLANIEQLCQEHQIADPDSLNIHTLIGPLNAEAQQGLLQRSNLLLLPHHPLQALMGRALGKTVLAQPSLVEPQWGCLPWQESAAANRPTLEQALKTPSLALDPAQTQAHSPQTVAQTLFRQLQECYAQIDLPARRSQAKADRQQRKEASREGRKQKYSLFHSDYQSDELKARRAWHERYANYFMAVPGEVVDIGSGSGIFLEILRDAQVPAFGVDPDPDMVEVCRELGLQALPGDERLLADCAENSLGGIHASHIIEHIDGSRAIAMIENALTALRPGGLLVIRTPNWRNATVRQEGFWLDITHVRPYPLPLLEQVLKDAGFEVLSGGFEEFGWNDTFIVGKKPAPSSADQPRGEQP